MVIAKFYRSRLSEEHMLIYDIILDGLKSVEVDIALRPCDNTNELKEIILAVNFDNPELFYVNFTAHWSVKCVAMQWWLTPIYYWDKTMILKIKAPIYNEVKSIIKHIGIYGNEYEREKRVHDYLTRRVTYDKEAAEKHNDTKRSNTIYGIFTEHKGVCEGIAKATQMLLSALNIYCILVAGQSRLADVQEQGNHAWNLVKINGEYSYLDMTWDLCLSNNGLIRYDYFNINERLLLVDHILGRTDYPYCASLDNDYYYKTGLSIESKDKLKKLILFAASMHYNNVVFRYTGDDFMTMEDTMNYIINIGTGINNHPCRIKAQCNVNQKVYSVELEW